MTLTQADIRRRIQTSAHTIASLACQADTIEAITSRIRQAFSSGGTLYSAGNGGSAAQALHLTEELIGRYKATRPPYPALCLCADPTALTCIANDFGFDAVFARQIEALLNPADLLLVLSTSGASRNIQLSLEAARAKGAATIALLGKGGGPCKSLCDLALIVDSDSTEWIQEAHQVVIHLILESLESA